MTIEMQANIRQAPSFMSSLSSAAMSAQSNLSKATEKAFEGFEFMAETLFDYGRGVDYSCQWISDYSTLSDDVKQKADSVKGAADRFNLFAAFSEMMCAGKALATRPVETLDEAVEVVAASVGSTADFTGRLNATKIISLSPASEAYVEGADALATLTLGAQGTAHSIDAVGDNGSVVSGMIKVAKNVVLAALGALCTLSACFASVAAAVPNLPLLILTASTAYLGMKVVDHFYEKLALQKPAELKLA